MKRGGRSLCERRGRCPGVRGALPSLWRVGRAGPGGAGRRSGAALRGPLRPGLPGWRAAEGTRWDSHASTRAAHRAASRSYPTHFPLSQFEVEPLLSLANGSPIPSLTELTPTRFLPSFPGPQRWARCGPTKGHVKNVIYQVCVGWGLEDSGYVS